MGGRFAGEIAGVELRDGGVEVFEVEHDNTRDSLLGVDLHDLERIVLNRLGVTARHANSGEGEVLTAGCQDAQHRHREADTDGCLRIFDAGISTMQDPGVYYPPAIVDTDVLGRYVSPGLPLTASNVRVKALEYARCGVLQTRCRLAELIEPRERGIEVCLVEDFAT